ncbi:MULTISPECIES: NADH-quinone oxidoreductase subunit L [unclassified Xanthobacter]|uniref:NADH-quinone oxidoreductase subunit L n=1 Tax=unclassified Xanthobacter TaxID=2623496 RepID=UPI001EE132C8|nr:MULTISPECIES: NADH-quinone oxidoreductase subunit L [unclassified Xanthobacter]
MYQAIVFLPLVGFLIAGLFGRAIGARASEVVTTTFLFISCLFSWITFVHVGFDGETARVQVLQWMSVGDLKIDWALRIDSLTAVMLIVVTTVSSLVHLYSIGYMHEDPSRPRFFAYLSLFTFAMLMLVTADNLVQMFFGWEGVGLASYLLIGFWYEKPSANAAAMKAFVVNRVGDFGFMLGMFALFVMTGSLAFDQVFAAAPGLTGKTINFLGQNWDAPTVIALLLFVGAMGKSAQLLLHTWLPDAMEGPTPVSALIHAATMVTAGVFMVARMSPVFELSQTALNVVMLVGATTAFFAATVALVQNDIKKVIAYSTCSQLGYMFVAMGAGAYTVGMFHLLTHAGFKALLFLCAGSVIHAAHHEQDMRQMGGLYKKVPFTYAMMLIGTLAITGFPFTAGYYSKDAIIEAAYASHNAFALYGWAMTVIAAALTSFYSWRLVFMTFHGKPRDHHLYDHAHESPPVMTLPLAVLGLSALISGYALYNVFVGSDVHEFFRASIYMGAENHILHAMHEIPEMIVLAPTAMMVLGFLVAYWFYIVNPKVPVALAQSQDALYRFLLNKWYFDELYNVLFVRPALWLGRLLWKRGDGTIIDGFGPDGVSARVLDVTGRVVRLQTGYLYHYAFVMLIGVAALLTWFMFAGV